MMKKLAGKSLIMLCIFGSFVRCEGEGLQQQIIDYNENFSATDGSREAMAVKIHDDLMERTDCRANCDSQSFVIKGIFYNTEDETAMSNCLKNCKR